MALSKYSGETNPQKVKSNNEEIKSTQKANNINEEIAGKITEKLEDSNLPPTNANIKMIANATELASACPKMTEDVIKYLIDNELDPTIENVYKATYAKSSKFKYDENEKISNEAWKQLKPQVEKALQEAELEATKENLDTAKWLIDNKLPLTEGNIKKAISLKKIDEMPKDEKLLERIVSTLSEGKSANETSLDPNDAYYKAKEIIKTLKEVSDQAVEETVERQMDVSIENLEKVQKDIDNGITQKPLPIMPTNVMPMQFIARRSLTPKPTVINKNLEIITARRQLEEARLKLTIESSQKLLDKGINIQTEKISKVVEELRKLEDDYYKQLLKEGNVSQTEDNINILRETSEKIDELKEMPSFVLGTTLNNRTRVTMAELHTSGETLKVNLDKANDTYDALMTKPRSDMGDSINKAFKNIDNMLKGMNLEITDANRRAVRILGYNSMEITEDSIMQVKQYDAEVNNLMKNLHPAVTVHMIREGVNPLKTPIADLNDKVTSFRKELEISDEEKYSRYLWKLEQDNAITPEERKSFIGIYRLLSNVEKTDGKALGALIKAGCEVTLDNLLTSVKTLKANGIDTKIDAQFGELEKLTFKQETISQQISASYNLGLTESQTNAVKYMQNMLYNILDEITPAQLKDIDPHEDIPNMTLEKLRETLAKASANSMVDKEYVKQQLENLRMVAATNERAISMLTGNKLPVTINNLIAANIMSSDSGFVFREINNRLKRAKEDEKQSVKKILNSLSEGLEDKETMSSKYEELEMSIGKILNKEYSSSTLTSKDIIKLKTLTNGISLVRSLSNEENYEIPLEVNGRIININVRIIQGAEESGKVSIKMESEKIGNIAADFNIKNGELKGLITCDNKDSIKMLRDNDSRLKERLGGLGITPKLISYIVDSKGDLISKQQQNNPDQETDAKIPSTKELYQTAKTFVTIIKNLEIQKI